MGQGPDSSSGDDQLAFFNKSGWICRVPLHSARPESEVKRYFFLPPDWLNTESLNHAQVTREGMLLCPKNGEVGVVQNGFRNEWSGGG
jgi:hypothetical protein